MATFTMTIQELIENNVDIFDFSYPLFKEEYRAEFEDLFINYFMFDEMGSETISRFKHTLKTRLNLVMPYWNKIYESQELEQRILDNYDITEIFTKTTINDIIGNSTNTGTNTNKNLYKDAPKTKIDISNIDIVNSITKDEGTNTNTNTNTNNMVNDEDWTRTMKGNMGVQTDSDAIIKWWTSIRNVTQEIFETELSQLFMGVY